jgi:hypothetical protein
VLCPSAKKTIRAVVDRKNLLELLGISDYFDVSAICTMLEERLMSIHDVQLAINGLKQAAGWALQLPIFFQENTNATIRFE